MQTRKQEEAAKKEKGNLLEKTEKRMVKIFTPKKMAILLTLIYAVSLIPLLVISQYNYPSADDYSIGSECHQIWMSTHSLLAVIGQGIVRAADDWLNWMGYFTSNYLMAIPPSTFGAGFYVLTAWIMLGMLTFSTIYLLHVIFVKVFRADKYVSLCVSMLMLFVTVQCMVGRVEAFYWYSGAANYMFVHGMSLFFYGLLISAVYDKGKKRIFDLTAASVLGFLTGGGNQMTALNGAIVVLTAAGFLTYQKKWKKYKALAFPMGFYMLGFLLNVAAPGNWVRAEGADGMNPVKAVLVSFYYCLDYCMSKWSGWPVGVLILALIPLFWHMAGKTRFRFSYPAVVVLFGYCLVSAMMTPPLFAVGNMEAERLQALTFAMYILMLTLCTGYVTGWVKQRFCEQRKEKAATGNSMEKEAVKEETGTEEMAANDRKTACFTKNELFSLLACLLFFVLASGVTVIPENHYFAGTSALTDLANGTAKAYGEALKERAEIYEMSQGQDVVVKPLPAQPELLYFSDISSDAEDWQNRGLCRFYGLSSVRVEEK